MNCRILAFSCEICKEGSSFSVPELDMRCHEIETELRTLAPAIGRVKASRLCHSISHRGGRTMVDFHLEPLPQARLTFGRRGKRSADTDSSMLWADLRTIVESFEETKLQISLVGFHLASPECLGSKLDPGEKRLRKVMRQRNGRAIQFESDQGSLSLGFPNLPRSVLAGEILTIACRILSVSPQGAQATAVSILDASPLQVQPSKHKHYLIEFANDRDNLPIAIDLLSSAFQRVPRVLKVRIRYEPLLNEIMGFSLPDKDRSLQ
jgi:hypothetical protein